MVLPLGRIADEAIKVKPNSECCTHREKRVTTGVSVIFGTIISNISNILAGPIWSGGRVEGLADGEEVGVEEYEDDSEKSCQFCAI